MHRPSAALATALVFAAIGSYLGVSLVVAERFSHPARHPVGRAPVVQAPAYEDVTLATSDRLVLRGWFFPVPADRAVVIVHGKDANRVEFEGRAEHIADFLVAAGYSVLLFDLRGHGDSEGERFSLGYYERRDVAAALEYVVSRGIAERRIGLIGISMGAATAIQELALHPGIGPIVADSAFEDAWTLLHEDLPDETGLPSWFALGVLLMARLGFGIDGDAASPISFVRAHPERPFLFIHCENDGLIRLHHSQDLLRASANPSSVLWVANGCEHAGAYEHDAIQYRVRVLAFFASQMP